MTSVCYQTPDRIRKFGYRPIQNLLFRCILGKRKNENVSKINKSCHYTNIIIYTMYVKSPPDGLGNVVGT